MTSFFDAIGQAAWAFVTPLATLVSISADLNLVYLGGGLMLAAGYFALSRRPCGDAGRFLAFMFPRRIYLSASAILDYKYYYCLLLLRGLYIGALLVGTSLSADLVVATLTKLFGAAPAALAPIWLAMALATIAEVLMFELGYWVAHRLLHEVPLLWEFHKTHHSATILTPATEARMHPVDDIIVGNSTAVFSGFGLGVAQYLFGAAGEVFTVFGSNIFFVVYLASYFHLRHTHVWVAFTGWFGCIVQSPAHHQCHHSANPRHFGCNLGYGLVMWDWLFGTLHVPCEADRENYACGIGPESRDYTSIAALFLLPFWKAARLARPVSAPDAAPAADAPST